MLFLRWTGVTLSPVGVLLNLALNGMGVWQFAQNTVWTWTAIGLGVFFACTISLAYGQHRRLAKLEESRQPTTKSEPHPSHDRQLEKEPFSVRLPWLHKAFEEDRTNLAGRVYSRGSMWSVKGLKSTDSFIEVIVPLINAAVFPILIEGVTGRLVISGHECAQAVEMEGRTRLPHGETGSIRLKQHLSQEMVNSMLTHSEEYLEISLKSCKLSILPEIPGEQTRAGHISVLGGSCNLPMSEVLGKNDWFAVKS